MLCGVRKLSLLMERGYLCLADIATAVSRWATAQAREWRWWGEP